MEYKLFPSKYSSTFNATNFGVGCFAEPKNIYSGSVLVENVRLFFKGVSVTELSPLSVDGDEKGGICGLFAPTIALECVGAMARLATLVGELLRSFIPAPAAIFPPDFLILTDRALSNPSDPS
jgi:hypothetical protein